MKSCSAESFETWLAQNGIGEGQGSSTGYDSVFPSADGQGHYRFWEYPRQRTGYARFLGTLLNSLDSWSGCYVYYFDAQLRRPATARRASLRVGPKQAGFHRGTGQTREEWPAA